MTRNAITICAAMVLPLHPVVAQVHTASAPGAIAARGAEVRASVHVVFGRGSVSRAGHQPFRFDVVAGPSFRLAAGQGGNTGRRVAADTLRVSFAPGHSTRLSLAGQPVFVRYANARVAAAAEADGNGGGISGWAIAGGVVLAGLGIAYLALEDAIDCNENGEYICE